MVDFIEKTEYEDTASPKAKTVKTLDKLETILQHNQELNPPGFNYELILTYAKSTPVPTRRSY